MPIRPPFALAEERFIEACTRCDDCIRVCQPGIMVRGDGGFPEIDFSRGGCTFCDACADACHFGAFGTERGERRLNFVAEATTACLDRKGVACRLCENWCPEDAIRFRPMIGGRSEVIINRARCTGCGACVEPCPAAAMSMIDSVEERMPA
ncbi:MAG: ferredoxin-type protein NapF [Hyphomicrobiales bacterium]|nr:ferredoxin-type protein NapF [Hyphomicrobiales bacterium]